jgi:AbrB family looped-hinge helix DNA binding protein
MKVTAKGQVTIPRNIRKQMGILPGSEVEFIPTNDGRIYLRKATGKSRGKRLVARLLGQGDVKMSTDEILALTRGKRPSN